MFDYPCTHPYRLEFMDENTVSFDKSKTNNQALLKWLDKMVEEGRIAVPPGGTLEKGSVISMFIRMLIHNAMEEQMRQAAMEAEDEDDDDDE